jgi:hypothetical protein
MKRISDTIFLALFAVGLWGCAVWVLAQDPLLLPLKRPHGAMAQLDGWRQWAFAAAPVLAGITLFSAARRTWQGGSLSKSNVTTLETATFLGAIPLLLLTVLTAPRM